MSNFIGIDIIGEKELVEKLAKLPPAAIDAGIEEANKYLVNVLRSYPPQKSVTRVEAYGIPFFSDKQRRFFFAALRDGRIQVPYHRTQALARGWKTIGAGRNQIIANEVPYAYLVMGTSGEQSRHAAKIGWQRVVSIIQARMTRILENFDAGVKKAIRKLGL